MKGKYGFKRFFRDGFGTVIEDGNRKYYEAKEVKVRNKIFIYKTHDCVHSVVTSDVSTFLRVTVECS